MLPDYIHFSSNCARDLQLVIDELAPDHVAILVDENTKLHCLPRLNWSDPIIEINSGEINKNLQTCENIWQSMTEFGFSRKSLLINVGGGVIGDMGGFAAATYKRGIRFVNIPTTLLSMVDASIGGKLGVDFHGLKNHIGVFQTPDRVIIDDQFLDTLPQDQLKSGFAEVLKHALISDAGYWDRIKNLDLKTADWREIIHQSVQIKTRVVMVDPKEGGLRKILNFGHSLGHAIETEFLDTPQHLLHGEAIAIGMILEGDIAKQRGLLGPTEFDEMTSVLKIFYDLPRLPEIDAIMKHLGQDKKNQGETLNFSLIDKIGNCLWDIQVSHPEIEISLNNYRAATQTD